MKKLSLTILGLYIGLLAAFSQINPGTDSTAYKSRKLKIDEINLVSSYYSQDGNNSAVEGGVGSEKLRDIANIIDVKLVNYDKKNRKHSYTAEVGIDNYTSASSDRIDAKANSSASSADTRIYPSLSWNMENEKTGNTVGLGVSFSNEFDYRSFGMNTNFSKKSKDRNREFGVKLQAFLDQVSIIRPVELRQGREEGTAARNSFSASLSLSQVVTQRLQLMFILDLVKQQGFLSLPFHRVYFTDGQERAELLPSNRFKVPVGFRANYFLGNNLVLRSFYRFYYDDWGLTSHAVELETAIKLTPFFSVTPFYRYYQQSGVDYFAGFKAHQSNEAFFTSNYDLSAFNSNFYGAGIRLSPPKGVAGIKQWEMAEIRYGHYNRSTGLNSDIISLNLRFK